VFSPPTDERTLPYLDGSIDIVVVSSPNRVTLREARRLAAYAVVDLAPPGGLPDGAVDALPSEDEDVTIDVQRMGKQSEVRKMPSASIIIPTHDGVEHLGLCLISLDETLPKPFRGEVIVVDDASGEEMQSRLEEWQVSRPYLR